uniref:holo-[acyl-carrier-protein] synthase n=1 Tax=Grammatophora oceanica TaxID=210454 RepID=A0A7S1UQ08_9STRA
MDLPVVDLPRTEYGKPFIPPTDDSDAPLFSVSHQFPFVGICRILDANDIPQNLRLGMDIVMFDEINSRLYSSEMDFCRVFQRSFAPGEWSCIERAQYPLQEFYLRWAIKEAYTKALGKGMSLKFDSFQTKLDVAACRYGWSLWDHLERPRTPSSQTNEEVHRLWGTISKVNSVDTTESERWLLMFIPLPSCGKNGYACICFGPAENEKALCETSLSRLDTTLSELIQFHVAARETEKNGTVTNDKCA